MSKHAVETEGAVNAKPRVVLVYTNTVPEQDAYVEEELRSLADSAGYEVVGELRQRRDKPDPHSFVGEGKVEELLAIVVDLQPDLVIVDAEISARQQHNLETEVDVAVGDRPQLILEIFAQRAHTSEGSLQVELAQSTYWLPRLMSRYTQFERQRGGTGTRGGAGEQQLESDRRRMKERIASLKDELDELREKRARQRDSRRRYPFPFAGLVGYTSAGKSTLLNTLSGSRVYTDRMLFSTLDPTTRRVALPEGYSVFLTDTVGFIRNLPSQLSAAFRATLEEVTVADFLVHVIDASHPHWEIQKQAVEKTLEELNADEKPVILVFNKCDLVKDQSLLVRLVADHPNSVYVSAREALGINLLTDHLVSTMQSLLEPIEALIPYSQSGLAADCYELGRVLDAQYLEEGILIKAEVVAEMANRLNQYRVP